MTAFRRNFAPFIPYFATSSPIFNRERYSQTVPHSRNLHGPVIRCRIQHGTRIAVEPPLAALSPQNRAIQVRRGDAKERKVRYREGELEDDERQEHPLQAPLSSDEPAGHFDVASSRSPLGKFGVCASSRRWISRPDSIYTVVAGPPQAV
jgi:hypothetical protein